jgi:hypothetical protein
MIYIIVGFVIGLSMGFHLGFYIERLVVKTKEIFDRDPEPTSTVVTPLRPGYADVNAQSAFVSPKTPQQIEREEQERVRSL